MKNIILIGDSIRIRYQPYVAEALAGVADVWGPEDNCKASCIVLRHLEPWVLSRLADVVHINCGLHDTVFKTEDQQPSDRPWVNLEQYKQNVRAILTAIRQRTDTTVIWATTTPVNVALFNQTKPVRRVEGDIEAYNAVATALAAEFDVSVNDLYDFVMHHGRDRMLCPDAVHFTDEGSRLLGRCVAEVIHQYL